MTEQPKSELDLAIEWLRGLENKAWEPEDYGDIELVCEAAEAHSRSLKAPRDRDRERALEALNFLEVWDSDGAQTDFCDEDEVIKFLKEHFLIARTTLQASLPDWLNVKSALADREMVLRLKEENLSLKEGLQANQWQPERLTIEEFSDRMLHKVVLDRQYSYCYGRDIAKEFPNGLIVLSGEKQ